MADRKLVGLVGYAGSGKDAAAEALVAVGWTRVAFADPVRQMALAIDPLIPCHVSRSGHLSAFVAAVGWTEAKRHPEVRRLLQRIGTEAVRDLLGQDVWVTLARRKIAAAGTSVVVTDVRFPNEAALIRSHGGALLRVTRPGVSAVNGHVSDQSVDAIQVDATLLNHLDLVSWQATVVDFVERYVKPFHG